MNQFLITNYKDSLNSIIWTGLQKCNAGLFKDTCTYSIAGSGVQTDIATPPPGGCPANAIITSVSYLNTSSVNNVQINYSSSASSPLCNLFIVNIATSVYSYLPLVCGSTSMIVSLPTCQNYKFTILTGIDKTVCGKSYSNTFTLPACTQTCKKVYTPIGLESFVVMPPFLTCDYQKPCISCATLTTLVNEFKTIYPGYTVPNTDSLTITTKKLQQNSLLARFLNYRTGFSKNAAEYLTAIKSCAAGSITTLCSFKKPANDASEIYKKDTMPCRAVQTQSLFIAQLLYQQRKDSLIANFDSLYKAKCLGAKYTEQFYATYQPKEYHYTLYFYDQAGNLVKTLPPAAVKPNYGAAYLAQIVAARLAATDQANTNNNEILATQYRYNSLNQVLSQKTPDAGSSKFWYDRLGRLAISQNAKQLLLNKYSYTLYDVLGRIQEVGQKLQLTAMTQLISQDTTALKNWVNSASIKEQITYTQYDEAYPPIAATIGTTNGLWQKNLRNRVSYTYVKQIDGTDINYPWDAATFYTYDIHGNVDTLYQDYKTGIGFVNCGATPSGNRFKKIVYAYDLISGKVNDVAYQPTQADQFYHHYNYDAENRLTEVKTSKDKIYWEREATYEYYRHGPLARIVLGQNQVQGLDYAYTLQGWLKGINSTVVVTPTNGIAFDMGQDGINIALNKNILTARDVYGFSLNYFSNDFKPINLNVTPFAAIPTTLPAQPVTNIATGAQLYNGNIAAMLLNIPRLGAANMYGYKYDQLNRIVRMDAFTNLNNTTNSFTANPIRLNDYHEEISYDPNGNIKTYLRNGDSRSQNMDNLSYNYVSNTNQLSQVLDAVTTATPAGYNDIKTQAANNYGYDAIGNLIRDNSEGISNVDWTVYGKIKTITKTNGTIIKYSYDASGNRISKIVTTTTPTVTGDSTYYVRDASGNVMSVYNKKSALNLFQTELHLYGSSRLGVNNVNVDVQNCPIIVTPFTIFTRANKFFELANHLGNVLVTISDKKIPVSSNNTTISYYRADIVTATDYYPFGMAMPGRNGHAVSGTGGGSGGTAVADLVVNSRTGNTPLVYEAINSIQLDLGFESGVNDAFETSLTSGGSSAVGGGWVDGSAGVYRYGFNGKENDNDVKGEGNQQDYGMRIYDPRLGRFLSVDPISNEYPQLTPYQFASNRPIDGIDRDGLEWEEYARPVNKVREYEAELYKTDPKHAEEIINHHKINAFITVGSMLSLGSGTALKAIGYTWSFYQAQRVIGVMNNPAASSEQKKENFEELKAAGTDIFIGMGTSKIIGGVFQLLKPIKSINVDLMGGATSSEKGFINFDPKAVAGGINDEVKNFSKYFGKNTVSEIIVNNPQANFLEEVVNSLKPGATVTVRGTLSNKFFKSVYNGKAQGSNEFDATEMKPTKTTGFFRTSGEPVQGEIKELKLTKKK